MATDVVDDAGLAPIVRGTFQTMSLAPFSTPRAFAATLVFPNRASAARAQR